MDAIGIDEVLARAAARRDLTKLPDPPVRRAIRVAAGATQRDLAATLGVAHPTIARYELGIREPKGDLRERYARVLERLASARG